VVCLESDLQDGQMMEVEVGQHSVLLTRSEGQYSAIGNQCTHYGAPLSKGVISGNTVRCPWHGACFNVHTGDLEEFPGMDCLPCHKVKIQNSKVYVTVNTKVSRQNVMVYYLSVSVGAASLICAETLRQENFGGRIIMVTRDDLLPYDKTRLSKVMNVENDSILLRRMEFFQQYDIEVWLRKEVMSVDTDKKKVTFDDGSVESYDQLLISTGCRAKGLDVPGMKLKNFKLLFLQMLSEKNVKFYMNDFVMEIKGVDGKVKEVVLKSGYVIPADVLIVGIGECNAYFFLSACISCLQYMRTNVPSVYCGGDLATFPLAMAKNQLVNIGHWQMAQAHARIAALNMLDKPTELSSVPFYWTVLLGKTIRYAGGLTHTCTNDEVIAAASLNYDPAVSAVAERFAAGKIITKKEAEYVKSFHLWIILVILLVFTLTPSGHKISYYRFN
uniref:Apoptosis inducing factor mitochondria associated 5 n=1 Tax=Sander lucioperca TaxID=283035 RepID=A0A8C9XGQ7_SANLU